VGTVELEVRSAQDDQLIVQLPLQQGTFHGTIGVFSGVVASGELELGCPVKELTLVTTGGPVSVNNALGAVAVQTVGGNG